MSDDKLELVKSTEASLSRAVSSVLGQAVTMHLVPGTRRDGTEYLDAASDPLPLSGPAYFMFKELIVGSFGAVSIYEEPNETETLASFRLHFAYKHHCGGSNGCEAGILDQNIHLSLSYVRKCGEMDLVWSTTVR